MSLLNQGDCLGMLLTTGMCKLMQPSLDHSEIKKILNHIRLYEFELLSVFQRLVTGFKSVVSLLVNLLSSAYLQL